MFKKPHLALDGYKVDHRSQYPVGTEFVYSNFTPRSAALANMPKSFDNKVVFVGLQGFILDFLVDSWNEGFFKRPKELVLKEYKRRIDNYLGPDAITVDHIAALHDLGYLPIRIKALPEGSRVNIKVPLFTVTNTLPQFFWLTNYLETIMSSENWKMITAATIAYEYRRILNKYVDITGSDAGFADFQLHDFSMRGLSNWEDAYKVGAAHLMAAGYGTDTLPAIDYLEMFYGANSTNELVGCSVPATEHSVMCMGGLETEIETFRRLINEVYPTGIVSIVSDTWDFWKVITEHAVTLKPEIMARKPNALGQAKVVFRPDSGDPVKILAGYQEDEVFRQPHGIVVKDSMKGAGKDYTETVISEAEFKGAVECLWDIYGGTVTDKGYKTLDQHVGLIYGDSITLDRCEKILSRLADKGFSAGNVVFGIGSFTYQYMTRDTFGHAMKATYGVVNGVGRELEKDPKTGDGVKKSAKGLLRVEREGDDFVLYDQQTPEQEAEGMLQVVFENGIVYSDVKLSTIRDRLKQ